jgi:ABC-2 type transport system ATP-binding protein
VKDRPSATRQPVLHCEGLRKAFGEIQAVNGVGFEIAPGESYGLLGPNGAGKTTTISIVAGLLEPDAGETVVAEKRLTTKSVAAKSAIGFVPQELAIYLDLTGRENLTFFSRLYGLSARETRKRSDEVLEVIGLSERAGDQAKTYSGGMKRRLNIGIGLLHEPSLLILDEPTVGVDPQSRNAILESVEELGERGMAVLYTTHYMEEAERLCDRVGIIDRGELKAEGTRDELVALLGEHDKVHITAAGALEAAAKACARIKSVEAASLGDGSIELMVKGAGAALPEILTSASKAGAAVHSVEVEEPNLEAVFLHLTGRALRD